MKRNQPVNARASQTIIQRDLCLFQFDPHFDAARFIDFIVAMLGINHNLRLAGLGKDGGGNQRLMTCNCAMIRSAFAKGPPLTVAAEASLVVTMGMASGEVSSTMVTGLMHI